MERQSMNKKTLLHALSSVKIHVALRAIYQGYGAILVLHRVVAKDAGSRLPSLQEMELSPELFESMIQILIEDGYTFIALDELSDRLVSGTLQKKTIVLTFDDGYLDNFIEALPILEKYEIPCTVYITTSFVERQQPCWWYVCQRLLEGEHDLSFAWHGEQIHLACGTVAEKESAFTVLKGLFSRDKGGIPQFYRQVINGRNAGIFDDVYDLFIDREQLSGYNDHGLVTIGAHTISHCKLDELDREEAKHEICGSGRLLQEWLGHDVRHFAYPFGARGEAARREFEIAGQCGYVTGATTRVGTIFPAHKHNMFALPRITVKPDTLHNNARMLDVYLSGLRTNVRHYGSLAVTC